MPCVVWLHPGRPKFTVYAYVTELGHNNNNNNNMDLHWNASIDFVLCFLSLSLPISPFLLRWKSPLSITFKDIVVLITDASVSMWLALTLALRLRWLQPSCGHLKSILQKCLCICRGKESSYLLLPFTSF